MQIVIVGAGKIGQTVASQLAREEHGVTIIEKNEAVLEAVLADIDVIGFVGSGVNSALLEQAGIKNTDLFIALTGSDEENLLCCLLARKLGAKNTIARVRMPEYSGAVRIISEELGLSMSVNPEKSAAMEMARILELPSAKKVETFAQGKIEMVDYDVDAGSPMCGKLVKDVFAKVRSALVCAVERGGEVYIPLGDFCFQAGDVMTIVAPAGQTYDFFRESGIKQKNISSVIISGGGRTSYYLAEQLIAKRIGVTVIEHDAKTAQALAAMLPKAAICHGDGTSQSVLDENGLSEADAFCCLTGIDEENILTSLYARHVKPGIKTVTKINRVELVPIVRPLGIGSIVSPKLIAADLVISYVRAKQNGVGSGVLTLYRIVDNKAEALEFEVSADSRLAGAAVRDLPLKDNVILAAINRDGKVMSPRGDDTLAAGDTLIVVTTHTGFDVLDDIING